MIISISIGILIFLLGYGIVSLFSSTDYSTPTPPEKRHSAWREDLSEEENRNYGRPGYRGY